MNKSNPLSSAVAAERGGAAESVPTSDQLPKDIVWINARAKADARKHGFKDNHRKPPELKYPRRAKSLRPIRATNYTQVGLHVPDNQSPDQQ